MKMRHAGLLPAIAMVAMLSSRVEEEMSQSPPPQPPQSPEPYLEARVVHRLSQAAPAPARTREKQRRMRQMARRSEG